jgi:hypothetical protein
VLVGLAWRNDTYQHSGFLLYSSIICFLFHYL